MEVGSRIKVLLTEPWDLVAEIGDSPRGGYIRKLSPDLDACLIQLEHPISYQQRTTSALIAMGRYSDSRFTVQTPHVVCSFIASDHQMEDAFDQIEPRKLASWLHAIGDVSRE
jgi:hypothetical protein